MSYTFRWTQPAESVSVAGSFEDWKGSVHLEKNGSAFEKTVPIEATDDKILYKYIVDGQWLPDHSASTDTNDEGIVNNVITKEDLKQDMSVAAISSVGSGASTTAMAGQQPLERDVARDEVSQPPPGAFPETPAANDQQTFSVNPIAASDGNYPPDNNKTVESTVHDDEELKSKDQSEAAQDTNMADSQAIRPGVEDGEQSFGVAPIAATSSMGNPISLAPGEKVPDMGGNVEDNAKYDQASYEKSDAQPHSSAPQSQFNADQAILGGPGPVIPESSMPMGNTADMSKEDVGPMMSGVGANSTTNQLAGQVPKEPRGVPEVVSESQQEAHADPEASANPDAVEEKKEVENELQKKVSKSEEQGEPAPTGSDSGVGAKAAAGVAAAGVGIAGAAVAANEFVKDKTGKDSKAAMPESVQNTVDEKAKESSVPQQAAASSTETDAARDTTTTVPSAVTESQDKAGFEHEAAAVPEAVTEKAAVEEELLKKVPESDAQGQPAPTATDGATATAVPTEVTESQAKAGVDPEAAASTEAVKEKAAVENELLKKVPESEAQGEPAPTESAAVTETAPHATTSSTGLASESTAAATAAPIATTLPLYGKSIGSSATPDASTTSATGAPQLGDPTAGVAPISMDSKPTDESALNASAASPAKTEAEKAKENEPPKALDSRDVSPMSKQPTTQQTQPEATTGVATAAIPRNNGASASTPQKRQSWFGGKGTPESSKTTGTPDSSKKDKRRSFFGKLKDKLKQ